MKYLWLELYKLKHRKVFLTFLVILGVELLFVFSNYGNNNNFLNMISDPAAPAWEDLIIGPAAACKNVIRFCAWNCDDNICSRYNSGFLLPCMYKPAYPYVYRYDRRTYWVYFHIAAAGYPQHFDLG